MFFDLCCFSLDQLLFQGSLLQMLLDERLGFWIIDFKGVEETHLEFRYALRLEYHEATSQVLSHFHQAPVVFKHSAVVGGAEDGHQLPIGEELIAIINHKMTSANEINFIFVTEIFHNLLIEGEADSSLILFPVNIGLLGVTPEEITKQASIRDVCRPLDILNLLWFPKFR